MNILYLSAHSILEHDELALLQELGHNVFSLHGAYQQGTGDTKRPPLKVFQDTHIHDIAMQCSRDNIHPEIIAWADVILVMHKVEWIDNNWKNIKHKKVIWRSIGQSTEGLERDLQKFKKEGLKLIRYSPKESTIPQFAGEDVLIRFYKDEDEYQGWTGVSNRVVNISQAMFGNEKVHTRGDHMNIEVFKDVVKEFPWKIFGPDNEYAGENNGGCLTYDDLKNMLRFSRVFFYTGTQPASYTLSFIEAFLTGIPVVAIGPNLGNSIFRNQQTYEVSDIITNGVNGFWSDDPSKLRDYIKNLLDDYDLAKRIGINGRTKAIEMFSKGTIQHEWDTFLKSL